MRIEQAIADNQAEYGIELTENVIARLGRYHDLVEKENALLHLVAPCSPLEFARRHILESLMLSAQLPANVRIADVGAGAGLPSIPCLIHRTDLRAVLIESKARKSAFLREALAVLKLEDRAAVVGKQFEEATHVDFDFVTCRALEKFSEKLPRLVRWARGRPMRLFAGPKIESELGRLGIKFSRILMPFSDQRFLFVCQRADPDQRTVRTK